jgi:hypothetical protein
MYCEHYSQVAFAVDEQVVGALAAQGADPAFADRVGPWRLDRSLDDLDVIGFEDGIGAGGVLGVSVPDQKPDRVLEIHKQVTGLLGHPRAGRVLGEAEKVDPPGGVLDADEHVDPLQQDGVDVREIDGEDASGLGGEELSPGRSAASGCG